MNKNDIFNKIKIGFNHYSEIVNKEIHYLYEDQGTDKILILKAKKNNFMHLCGVDYKLNGRKVSPNHFFSLVKDNRINPDNLILKSDGTTILKLEAIVNLNQILTKNIKVLNGKIKFSSFNFDKGLRTRTQDFALALIDDEKSDNKNLTVPYSLLKINTANTLNFLQYSDVKAIYYKEKNKKYTSYYYKEP
ncbi:PBECR4 domain-containing protein [Staphylococcus hominis]|uniref:PBECR4 domain-containing protein n=1 Tax=Staphylococcus hominis TaxID=1290 RepID=UPI00066BB7A4|nr:PBECR4 domain-containing protein [Staphylococcus hominis]